MPLTSIPTWNSRGVIPPINELNPVSVDRSPYPISLNEFVSRFSHTPQRLEILDGFLNYRAELHKLGLTIGFQWLDGSFLEDVELLESRAPEDIDVVTFYQLPPNVSQTDLLNKAPLLFPATKSARKAFKAIYHTDAYMVCLDTTLQERLVASSAYWYSMWSHRRNQLWKGYLQIDLAPVEDVAAKAILIGSGNPGAQP
ncbi:hypothetical protein SAMN02949497_2353 [Methylomagnum ishizawai]|uniref:Uncharacterized protein n=1 Tax=Methylomagnum ishizawai TaxID=1760988 RepID=A0A1Y6D2C0_9GAMM|nr:hypothetical protein [Methylomagnum ishizawai]SMF95013.1 hypothetical protein SAMN02949497_2353 [Methylomagnum ishizawai]